MKAGETPQVSEKWWSKNKAVTLGPTGLGKALKAFEVAEAKKRSRGHGNRLARTGTGTEKGDPEV